MNNIFKNLFLPSKDSHKGQNGRLMIIGGSRLFHSASLWALKVASRIVDLVHYSSTDVNNKIVHRLKDEFRDGIVVPRTEIESYIEEDDCILIGPGMVRAEGAVSSIKYQVLSIKDIENIKNEGELTYYLTRYLLNKYPQKKWVIDAGALQMMDPEWIPEGAILTPHHREFEGLLAKRLRHLEGDRMGSFQVEESVRQFVKQYHCTVLLKGEKDIIVSKERVEIVEGGNAGMTKGGTGDVLAGLVAALYCKNDAFTASYAASYINKKAGEDLYKKMGLWFNASDLADQLPRTMKRLIL